MPRPGGNPDIRNVRKVGPVTDIGKLKSVLASTEVTGFKPKHETALMKRIRLCNKCPLGEKLITIKIKDKTIERTKPADCSYYAKDKTECVIPVSEWAEKVKMFWDLEKDTHALQKMVILDALSKATTASEFETIKKGYASFEAREWTEIGLKYLTEYNKLISGVSEKHLHLHGQDMADRIVDKVFMEEKDGKNKNIPNKD